MAPRDEIPARRMAARRQARRSVASERRAAARGMGGGPWQWRWRRRSRRRRALGCLLWVVTLLFVLLVLSVLFGGFQRGARTGAGQPHGVQPYDVQPHVVSAALVRYATR
jgi:ABC-type Fe3+ transport system permease subunit